MFPDVETYLYPILRTAIINTFVGQLIETCLDFVGDIEYKKGPCDGNLTKCVAECLKRS